MRLPAAKPGDPLVIRRREVNFTFWPMRQAGRRWGVHSTLYAADPWAVIEGSVRDQISNAADRGAAVSWVRQAREYYMAAERANAIEPRPLLYYYAFLNLGKAIAVARKRPGMVGKVGHGILEVGNTGFGAATAQLEFQSSGVQGGRRQAVDELHRALEGSGVRPGHYPVSAMISQSVVAHRMWCDGFPTRRRERFIGVDAVVLLENRASKHVWARIRIRRDSLKARGRGLTETLKESGLSPTFRAVRDPDPHIDRVFHTFEQVVSTPYTGRGADVVMDVVRPLRSILWETVTASDPYRRFYLYLSPQGERRVPQWLSVYSTFFWLGSLTRYRPLELLAILEGPLGPFFREFLETQPTQLLYVLASELQQQEVSRAGIV